MRLCEHRGVTDSHDPTAALKIRFGVGLGTMTAVGAPQRFADFVDRCESLGFDSLWLSERINASAPDPLVALAVAAGRTEHLKLGTSVLVLPGRNPVVLAKEMATLDVLSGGRFLPAVGLGAVDSAEQRAFGVRREERGRRHDEALALLRACWTGEVVSFHGEFWSVDDVQVLPVPLQPRLDVWLGGIAPSELRRVGRVGDGWLPSFCTPEDVAAGIATITAVASEHDRTIDPQHFGVLLAWCDDALPDRIVEMIGRRRPGLDPRSVVPTRDGLVGRVHEFIAAGASKFVLVPLIGDPDPDRVLGELADDVLPLTT